MFLTDPLHSSGCATDLPPGYAHLFPGVFQVATCKQHVHSGRSLPTGPCTCCITIATTAAYSLASRNIASPVNIIHLLIYYLYTTSTTYFIQLKMMFIYIYFLSYMSTHTHMQAIEGVCFSHTKFLFFGPDINHSDTKILNIQ